MRKRAEWIGIILTTLVHAGAITLLCKLSLATLDPPPVESSILLDFEDEITPEVIEQRRGREPRSEDPDKDKPVELAQRSESPSTVSKQNLTTATKQDDFGDVDVDKIEHKEEPKLDPRASFPGMAKKDTTLTSDHSAQKSSSTYKAGQSDGNTSKGNTDGRPNAHLKGRKVEGNLPRPEYTEQDQGWVVVDIWVDQYGTVQKAVPGGDGTTVSNKNLWAAARKAAMETHFNMNADAPALQEGTITYIFKLK